jgi:hypothetical protein
MGSKYQYCIGGTGGHKFCSSLNALPGRIQEEDFPGANEKQIAALQLLVKSSLLFDTSDGVEYGLEVTKLLGNSYIHSLPDDQWIREIVRWERFIWASMQTTISDYAIGYVTREPSAKDFIIKNATEGEKQLCGVQRMRKSGDFM